MKYLEIYHSTEDIPTALREREDDILPYGGWGILAGTIQPGLCIALVHATPHQLHRAGQGTCWIGTIRPCGIKKPVAEKATGFVVDFWNFTVETVSG